ncbi:MAG: hypothetical protein JSU68_08835 [Phycisphaerales bacterium]|nr:MAG: hypothetical protein JSU68_08835 [Phycisphaerales bacterium]
MIGDTVLSNPICWGQFRLMGGARRVGMWTGAYAVIAAATFGVACRFAENLTVAQVADYSLYFVGFAQLILILPIWGNRIYKAVWTDINGKMMESHRLSPTTGSSAVVGYMIGPGLQVACLCMVNLVAGIVLCSLSGKNMTAWLAGHVYILFLAVFAWSSTVLASLCVGKAAGAITALFVVLLIGAWRVVEFVPGLGLICGTEMIGYCTRVAQGGNPGGLPAGAGLSLVVQILVILLWMRGAAGKFERPDLPALSTEWASLAYAGWLVVALLGLARAEELRLPLPLVGFAAEAGWQIVATLIVSLLFVILPLRSAAVESQGWLQQHRDLAGDKPSSPEMVALLLALTTVIMIASVPVWLSSRSSSASVTWPAVRETLIWTTASVVLTYVSVAAMYRAACALRWKKVDSPVMWFVFVVWILLPLGDGVLQAYREAATPGYVAEPTALTACSPAGGLILAWNDEPLFLWEGLVFQAAVCLGLFIWQRRAVRAVRARRVLGGRQTSGGVHQGA